MDFFGVPHLVQCGQKKKFLWTSYNEKNCLLFCFLKFKIDYCIRLRRVMFQSSINKDPWPTKILSCRFPCYISLVLMSHQFFILFTGPPWEPQHRENISPAFKDSFLIYAYNTI